MKMKWALRGYQRRFCRQVVDTFRRGPEGRPMKRLLGVAATGAGKTIMASGMAFERRLRRPEQRTLFLADSDELCDQAIDKFHRAAGIFCDLEKASHQASLRADCVVASIQSISRPKRLARFPEDHFGLVIADEAHLSMSASWKRVLKHFGPADQLGITATPERGDKISLLRYWEHIAAEISLRELIDERQLSPIVVQTVPIRIPVQAKIGTGDDQDDVAEDIRPYFAEVLRAIQHHAAGRRRILVFHPSIKASQEFSAMARDLGIAADHVDGADPDRAQKIEAFRVGKIRMLSNAQLLVKGFDCQEIDCVIVLRPTKSRGQYIQMIGRGTRLYCPHGCAEWCDHPDRKQDSLLLDFLWEFADHNVMGPADIVTDAPEQRREIAKRVKEGDILDLLKLDREIVDEREQRLIKRMQEAARRNALRFDARTWAAAMHQPELDEYRPVAPWQFKPVSPKQEAWLLDCAVEPETVQSRGHASAMIDVIQQRRRDGLSSPEQIVQLAQAGLDGTRMTYQQAEQLLRELNPDPTF